MGGALLGDLSLSLGRGDDAPHLGEGVHIKGQVVQFALIVGHRGVGVAVEGGKAVDVVPHLFIVGMEDVRTVAVDGDTLHILCVDVAGDVAALIDDQALFAGGGGLVGKDGAEQTGTDDQIIILHFSSPFLRYYANAAQFAAGTQNRGHPWQAGWTG